MNSSNLQAKLLTDIVKQDIFVLIGLEDLEDTEKEKLRGQFTDIISKNAFTRLTDDLERGKLLDKFEQLEGEQEIEEFLNSNNIDINQYFIEEGIRLKVQLKTMKDLISVGVKPTANKNSEES